MDGRRINPCRSLPLAKRTKGIIGVIVCPVFILFLSFRRPSQGGFQESKYCYRQQSIRRKRPLFFLYFPAFFLPKEDGSKDGRRTKDRRTKDEGLRIRRTKDEGSFLPNPCTVQKEPGCFSSLWVVRFLRPFIFSFVLAKEEKEKKKEAGVVGFFEVFIIRRPCKRGRKGNKKRPRRSECF